MTEPAASQSLPTKTANAHRSRRIIIGAIALLVLIAAAAVFASKAGLDKALVRQQLDAIAADMKTRGAAQGRDVAFTYGEIEIQGGFSDRHAVVHNPALAVKPLVAEGAKPESAGDDKPRSLLVSTDSLLIRPESATLSAMKFSLPQPLKFTTVEAPEKNLLTIAPATPLEVYYATHSKGDTPYAEWNFTAPTETKLTYLREQQAIGEEDATPTITPIYHTLVLAMDSGKGALSLQRDGGGLGDGNLELKNIAIWPGSAPEEGKITIRQIVSQWSNQRNEKNLNVVNSSFVVDSIEAAPELLPYAPVSAEMNVSYEGAMPSSAEEVASIEAKESAFKLKSFKISTKDATFSATADFSAAAEDHLPVGAANVTITNLPFILGELKKFKLLPQDKEELLAVLLQQVTGTPYADLKDVNIDVNRARGGSFSIGKSTFEELFATLLGASLSKGNMKVVPSAPTIPAEGDRKAQEPVNIPDNTRG